MATKKINKAQFKVLKMLLQGNEVTARKTFLESLGMIYTTLKSDPNYFIDERDYNLYSIVEINGQKWLGENLQYKVGEGSYCYDNCEQNGSEYGRLYTWNAGKEACPKGWRLPSDSEWRELSKLFGGCDEDSTDDGAAAYKALIDGGSSGFNALLGGFGREGGMCFKDLSIDGNYWSNTLRGTDNIWSFYFDGSAKELSRHYIHQSLAYSCRCIKI